MKFNRLSINSVCVGMLVLGALLASFGYALAQQKLGAPPAEPPGPTGLWVDHTGRGAIEIAPCEGTLCGRIVWLQEPTDKYGQPLLDRKNEDRAKRDQPICGLQIIGDLRLQSDGSWDRGWIYDPEQGERFDVELRLRAPDVLQVKGYKGFKFLSETYHWTRAQTPPPSCEAQFTQAVNRSTKPAARPTRR